MSQTCHGDRSLSAKATRGSATRANESSCFIFKLNVPEGAIENFSSQVLIENRRQTVIAGSLVRRAASGELCPDHLSAARVRGSDRFSTAQQLNRITTSALCQIHASNCICLGPVVSTHSFST